MCLLEPFINVRLVERTFVKRETFNEGKDYGERGDAEVFGFGVRGRYFGDPFEFFTVILQILTNCCGFYGFVQLRGLQNEKVVTRDDIVEGQKRCVVL